MSKEYGFAFTKTYEGTYEIEAESEEEAREYAREDLTIGGVHNWTDYTDLDIWLTKVKDPE